MKRKYLLFSILVVIGLSLLFAPKAAALPTGPTALNARFFQWQEKEEIIHIQLYDDMGNRIDNPAVVDQGQPVIIGHEWANNQNTLEELEAIYNNPDFDLQVSVDGGPYYSVKEFIQPPFVMTDDCSGPRMYWDHDFDGRGDTDGDGIGDFCDNWPNALFMFVRVPYQFREPGLHILNFQYSDYYFGGPAFSIYVEVLAP